ncbi:hypothetical protein M413DRAFT_24903 [Hebeloma cylindrosporum]|uniref:Uncharacterized protein n=1 Tax=Hebeloma cylindrosporum TaxID=76867 RepID=A0A0C2YTQ0_HEBCY|nr:hypothetical protein M413DRAFT_24903 [Hebeloma cylindrosporum h7]
MEKTVLPDVGFFLRTIRRLSPAVVQMLKASGPAIRRVYLHIPTTFAELKKKLEQAEQRLVDKTKECDNLKDSAAKKLEQAEQRLTEKTTECDNLKADASRLAAKSLQYYHKNAELSVEKTDLMNVIKDLEIDLYNTNESRQAEEKEEKAIQELKDATNILILELLEAEDRLRDNHIRLDDLRYEIIDLERKLSIARERIDADAGEADAISVMINDLELESQSRLDENERFKMYNRDLRTTIYDLGRKKELAEENLKVIVARVAAALTPPQQASGSSLRKRSLSLAAPLPIASGSHLAAKPLPKRRKIKLESLC